MRKGGDVFDRLGKKETYTEREARTLARNLLETIADLHRRGIVHRDLKPENLLLMSETDDSAIKLADFGFAKYLPKVSSEGNPAGLLTKCGTPSFVAPEILHGVPYNHLVDMWSAGVLIYMLLGGYPPFQAKNQRELFRKVRASDYVFHEKEWDSVSVGAKKLIASCLTVDPHKRIEASHALKENVWLNDTTTDDVLSLRSLNDALVGIKHFNAKRKLKGAGLAVHVAVASKFWDKTATSVGSSKRRLLESESISPTNDHNQAIPTNLTTATSMFATYSKKPTKIFDEIYSLTRPIRKGTFATVYEGRIKIEGDKAAAQDAPSEPFAIKVVIRKNITHKDEGSILNEVAMLQSLRAAPQYFTMLEDFMEEKDKFFIVMEYCSGGDLFDKICQLQHYSEADARTIATVMLKGVQYMHSLSIAHRDLKPQNLILKNSKNDTGIKIADFGFARRVHTPRSLTTRCGTPTYVAPEILKNIPHDQSVDLWSIGIIVYVLLVGYPPFMEDDHRTLFRKIRVGSYTFPEEDWSNISAEAKNFISTLLVADPLNRLTAAEALKSPWISSCSDEDLRECHLSDSHDSIRSTRSLQKDRVLIKTKSGTIKPVWLEKGYPAKRDVTDEFSTGSPLAVQ